MKKCYLLTGASGLVGNSLLKKLSTQDINIFCIENNTEINKLFRTKANITILKGSILKKQFGLSKETLKLLNKKVTHVLHCAAKTDFSMDKNTANNVNVRGTKNLLELIMPFPNITKVGLISTVYVAGKLTGNISEEIFHHSHEFVNEYERSKYYMELTASSYSNKLPIILLRLSTVIGDLDGKVHQFNALHQALRLYYNGFVPMVPGVKECPVDLITLSFARDAILYLLENPYKSGKISHICAGTDALSLSEFLELTFDVFSKIDPNFLSREIEPARVVNKDIYDNFEKIVYDTNNPMLIKLVEANGYFLPQLNFPKTFDNTITNQELSNKKIYLPKLNDYYDKILLYCLKTKWGRLNA